MEFRDAVRYLRNELGITQTELASAMRVNPVTVGRWENSRTVPSRSIASVLMDYARSRNVSAECLRVFESAMQSAARSRLEKRNGPDASVCETVRADLCARFESFIENINGGVTAILYGENGEVLYAYRNKAYLDMIGYTAEQFGSELTKPYDIVLDDDVSEARSAIESVRKTGKSAVFGFRAKKRDGDIIYLRCSSSLTPVDGIGDNVVLTVITDITDSVEAAEHIEAQRDAINKTLNTTPSGIAVIEADPRDLAGTLRTTYYNDRFYGFSGYSRDEYDALLKKNEFNFVYEEDAPALIADTKRICEGDIGCSESTVVRCHTKDGGYRWLLLTGQLAEKRGDTCVVNISLVDITLRKEAEDKLRISEEMLRTAAETDKRAVIVYNIKAGTCRVKSRNLYSTHYEELIENVPESIIARDIVAADSAEALRELFRRIKSGERNFRVSLLLHTGEGDYQWFECNAVTVADADGNPDHAIMVFHNITEQRVKEAVFRKWKNSINTRSPGSYSLFRCNLSREASLDEQNGELLKVHYDNGIYSFDERTEEYANQYVYPDDRERYIAVLNSDTLLAMFYRGEHAVTLEYREIDENGDTHWRLLTVEMVEYLNSDDIQAFLMYEDIDEKKKAELLETERAESDPLTGVLNRAAFAEKVEALISGEAGSQHALLMMDMDGFKQLNDTFGHAVGDQALMDVAAVLRSVSRDGDLVCRLGGDEFLLWLRGIPYDAVIGKVAKQICTQVNKAFSQEVEISASVGIAVYPRDGHNFDELYHKADNALYRVKQSGKNDYAFFSAVQDGEAAGEQENEVKIAKTSYSGIKRRMLIVDDDGVSRSLLSRIFRDEYTIDTAKNGAEAIMRIRHFNTAISVVLLDVVMPMVDGFEVLKKMQEGIDTRTIPVVVVSGDENRETLLKAIECGAADYVTKPIDPELIRIRVKSAVSKAENERLRAQNSYLQLQRDEDVKFHTVLESTGTVVVEYDWRNHVFAYANDIEKYIAGSYNHRSIWQIFLTDMVAESRDVKLLQDGLLGLANDRERKSFTTLLMLKTPSGAKHWFRTNIYKQVGAFGLAEKMIITFNDVHEEVLANEKLLFQATRDELTGLYNRAGFFVRASELITSKEPGYYVMACIDIERFKVINDQYGTEKGDDVLRSFGTLLCNFQEPRGGICCRVMADNFAVLYPAKLMDTAELEASRREVELLDGSIPPITYAAGRFIVDDKTLPISTVYDRATIAMETVKGHYDSSVATYDESMRTSLLRQQEITGQMKEALAGGQFEVWLQPQFNHATGKLSGAEALVRWRHPEYGIIPPSDFIPIFEQNGFVYEVDKFVWEQVCRLIRSWLDRGLSPVPVSVNVSRYDVLQSDVVEVIVALTKKYSLPFEMLRLEITESAFTDSTERIINVVKRFVELGFVVEIDDFGSGYSSLNTLKDVPAQVLKMDMRFLENDSNAQRGGSIIESVVRMARWLGMSVIAEGVETVEQADYLRSIGCEHIQGYLYAKPTQLDEYERLFFEGSIEPKPEKLKTADTWNNNAFWNPKSMETLIFNSYIGGACIFEYRQGVTELLRYNKAFTDMFGAAADTSVHRDIFPFADDENRLLMQKCIDEALETKQESYCEIRLKSEARKSFYVHAALRQLAKAGDRILIYCVVTDVTSLHTAKEEISATADKLNIVLNSAENGISAAVIDGNRVDFLFANDKLYDILGIVKGEFNTENLDAFLALVHPDDREKWYSCIQSAREVGKRVALEYRMLRADSSITWVSAAISVVRLTGIDSPVQVSVYSDITKRKQNEKRLTLAGEQLAEAERVQAALMDNLPAGVALYEFDGHKLSVIHINKSYWDIVGRAPVDYTNASVTDVIYPDDRAVVFDEITSAIRQSRVAHVNARILCGKDEYRPFSIRANINREANGKYLLSVSYEPITDSTMSLQEMLPIALSTMMTASADLSFIKDADGRYIACSNTVVSTIGLSSVRDVIGKTSAEVFGAEASAYAEEEDRRIYETGKPVLERQIVLPLKYGKSAIFLTSKYPLLDGGGKVIGIYTVCRNVTAEKATEFELQTLLRVIPSGVLKYSADESTGFAYVNHSLIESLGYTPDEFGKKFRNSFNEMVWKEDRERVQKEILEQEGSGKVGRFEYRIEAADGSLRWFHDEGVKVTDEYGKEWYYVTLVDITAQRKSEESLRLAEEEYRIATRHSGHTIGRYDIAARTLTITDDVATRLALPECIPDVPYGRVKLGKISEDTASAYIAFYENIMKGEKEGTVTFRKLLTIGWRWITEHSTTIFDEQGRPVSAIISYKDVTEQQEKELAYKKWQQSIEGRDPGTYTLFRCNLNKNSSFDLWEGALMTVNFDDGGPDTFDNRTRIFAEECVYRDDRERYMSFVNADTMLAEYHRGHRTDSLEFRQALPDGGLRWIKLSVDLVESPNSSDVEAYLLYESIDEQKKAELEAMHLAETDPLTGLLNRKAFIDRVNALIASAKSGDVYAFLMLDVDGFKLLNDSFGHAAGDEALTEIARKLEKASQVNDVIGRIGGDEFVMFISNAGTDDAVGSRAEQICLRLAKVYSAKVRLTASIGVSLFPRDGSDAHSLYEKADTALYSAKENGRNAYCIFSEELPEKSAGADTHEMDTSGGASMSHTVKKHMLIVDDSKIDRTILKHMFDSEYDVEAVPDGMTALTRMRYYGSALSVVLLDLNMSGMSGFDVLEKAQKSPEMLGVPIIVVSGENDSETCMHAVRSGAADYVTKPVQPELIRLRVIAAVSRAENERLRAQNSFLQLRDEEIYRYQSALGSMGMFVAELDLQTGIFAYDSMISNYLKGTYNGRALWDIFWADSVADSGDIRKLQEYLRKFSENTQNENGTFDITLCTAAGKKRPFRLNAEKVFGDDGKVQKLIITFRAL